MKLSKKQRRRIYYRAAWLRMEHEYLDVPNCGRESFPELSLFDRTDLNLIGEFFTDEEKVIGFLFCAEMCK